MCNPKDCGDCNPPPIFPIPPKNPIGIPIINAPLETNTAKMIRTVSDTEPIPTIGAPFEQLEFRKKTIGSFVINVGTLLFLLFIMVLILLT